MGKGLQLGKNSHHRNTQDTMVVPKLPSDILGAIVDLVASERERNPQLCLIDLKACSRTCHTLAIFSRKHIFAEIRVGFPAAFQRLETSITARQFTCKILNSPWITTLVRKLILNVEALTADTTFVEALMMLQNLQTLELSSLWGGPLLFSPQRQSSLIRLLQVPTLTHLVLNKIRDFPAASLINCVKLTHLVLDDATLSYNWNEPISIFPQDSIQLLEYHFKSGGSNVTTARPDVENLKLLDAQRPDGLPLINFTNLRSLCFLYHAHKPSISYERLMKVASHLNEVSIQCGS